MSAFVLLVPNAYQFINKWYARNTDLDFFSPCMHTVPYTVINGKQRATESSHWIIDNNTSSEYVYVYTFGLINGISSAAVTRNNGD